MKNWISHLVYITIIALIGVLAVMSNRMLQSMTARYSALVDKNAQLSVQLASTSREPGKCKFDLTQRSKDNFQISVWANVAAVRAYTFSFLNYQEQFNRISQFFVPSTWASFKLELEKSNLLKLAIAEKMIVESVAKGSVTITKQGVVKGRYQWSVLMPLQVVLSNGVKTIKQSLLVNLTIIRVSPPNGNSGLAILGFNAVEAPK